MFGEIEAITTSITGQSDKVAGILAELSEIFNGSGINPETSVVGNSESGFSIQGGGTFIADEKVHGSLANQLNDIVASSEKYGSSEITGAGKVSKELKVLTAMGEGLKTASSEYVNLSNLVQEKIQNIDSLKEMLRKGFNKLYELASTDSSQEINKGSIKDIEDKVFSAFDKELGQLQNILKVQIKPTQKDLLDLLKKNKSFTTLAETLGVQYGNETASDRLALVFTNMSDIKILADKVKNALKELNISNSEYKNITNSEKLYNELYKVFEKINNKKIKSDLTKVFEAMSILKNAHGKHEQIIKELKGSNDIFGTNESSSSESESSSSESESEKPSCSAASEIEGGVYSNELVRQRKTRLKSSLSKRIDTYEKTMKELYKSFMNQVNRNFKELSTLFNLLSTKIGSEVSYDDDLKDFINMFKGFNEDIDNEKIFYSLIGLDVTTAGSELKNRFLDTLDKIIASSIKLNNYKVFIDITKQLKHFKETIDTMGDTVNSLKKSEVEKSGSSDFMWTDKLVPQSFSMNNIKLIKDSIKKLSFYGKVSTIKENLYRMNKEQKLYQEDYDQLLGKSIGLKLTELKKEYVENVDRLNDKQRGRGRLLEEHNKANDPSTSRHLPRGLVETIYKLQYEAKEGLYKSLEAIDLYLMHFTESLSAHPEAVMDLHKMLEQTDVIAKWFTEKSVDNLVTLFKNNDVINPAGQLDSKDYPELNLPNILVNNKIVQNKIKEAFEQTKKCIDSISVLKNILSMFVHLGEKYGNINLTDKLNISPNLIYKHLVKYIWVSAFTMGYATSGGDIDSADGVNGDIGKGPYVPEKGDFSAFFDVLFTTIIMPLDIYKDVETKIEDLMSIKSIGSDSSKQNIVNELKKRFKKDIFIIDDRYFILALKAMVGKIFTVVDTHTLLHTPDTLANIMRNPVRMIIGAGSDPEIIPDAIELYIRLPLLVEFYKTIFGDGNILYKNNDDSVKNNELEIIAYIPEIGTVWSGLIQCIFDESKYIKDGLYSINNMKDIVNEVNKIYNNYKSTSKDKLVKTIVLDLVSEINRRYGILKNKDIAEFYQIKKKYIKHMGDSKFEDNVDFDILDENNEYERAGPSSQFVESTFNKYSYDSLVFSDIKLVRDFRNKIYNELFGDDKVTTDLSSKSFNEKIKYYKKQIKSTESTEEKFELIAQAIDQSSNINAQNMDVYLLFHELVMSPIKNLSEIGKNIHYYISLVKKMHTDIKNATDKATGDTLHNTLELIKILYQYFNDGKLFKVKMISNTKFLVDYSNLQIIIESYIENIKYMISKFRNLVCKELINGSETILYRLENVLLNIIIKDDSSAEGYDANNIPTLEDLNKNLNELISTGVTVTATNEITDGNKKYKLEDLYKHIMFGETQYKSASRDTEGYTKQLLSDINVSYNPTTRSWVDKINVTYSSMLLPDGSPIKNNDSFKDKSILQKFNMLVFSYIIQFYNPATKKIYSSIFNNFSKIMSVTIFEQGGIPDMNIGDTDPFSSDFVVNQSIINNGTPLSMTIATVLRTLLTRTLNVQLPVRYHLLDDINQVSFVQLEKYKAYLPVFITYFKNLTKECIMYKKLLDNSDIVVENSGSKPINVTSPVCTITDDFGKDITGYTTKFIDGNDKFSHYKNNFHEMLNSIIRGSDALVLDAQNVLNELNYIPQFGNIQDNFIKNFYNNNMQLPYMPLSILDPTLDNKSTVINNLLPIHSINSNENKYIYGTNNILNIINEDKEEDINNYLWLKEQLKIYNNSALSTNIIDANKLTKFLTLHKNLIHSSYISNHINHNLYWNGSSISKGSTITLDVTKTTYLSGATVIPNSIKIISYFTLTNSLSELINMLENQLNENKKNNIINEIITNSASSGSTAFCATTNSKYDLNRKKARILNIIDLNINPINVHALMREVPLVNIYNYAFTFDNIIKSFIYNINPDDLYSDTGLINSKTNKRFQTIIGLKDHLPWLSCLLQDPYFIDYKFINTKGTLIRSKITSKEIIEKALQIENKPTSFDPKQPNIYLSKPKYTTNLVKAIVDSTAPIQKDKEDILYNNKFFRNIFFLINLQRVIRLKVKNAVYKINTNVVSDTNILNMRITDYPTDNTDINDDEFEITDLF